MSEKIGIKSLNGHPLVDEDVRKRVAALEESGGSGGGSAGGGSPVVLFMKDGDSLNCTHTAAQIVEMMDFMDGTAIFTHMPTFMLSDNADAELPLDGSAGLVDFPMIPCIMVRPYFAIHDTGAMLLVNIDLEFCDKNAFKVMILPEDNEIKLKFAEN